MVSQLADWTIRGLVQFAEGELLKITPRAIIHSKLPVKHFSELTSPCSVRSASWAPDNL